MGPLARRCAACALLLAPCPAWAADDEAADGVHAGATFSYYAMRDQPDFSMGVATLDRGRLHLEARYNYEGRDAASAFAGWKLEGGDEARWQVVPIAGVLFNKARGAAIGFEAAASAGRFDAYVEAEAVRDLEARDASYLYAWSEIGWLATKWLRIGLAGQRTRLVDSGRDVQPGAFAQVLAGPATIAVYAFDPDRGSRYFVVALAGRF